VIRYNADNKISFLVKSHWVCIYFLFAPTKFLNNLTKSENGEHTGFNSLDLLEIIPKNGQQTVSKLIPRLENQSATARRIIRAKESPCTNNITQAEMRYSKSDLCLFSSSSGERESSLALFFERDINNKY
jgi:hypothetical protein